MNLWRAILLAVGIIAALSLALFWLARHPRGARPGLDTAAGWQRMANPGALSRAHEFLAHNCAACHTPARGVEPANCIVCHANNIALLQRQPTAFHADISRCAKCHREHQGVDARITTMDHAALARIGLRQLATSPDPDSENRLVAAQLTGWWKQSDDGEAILNCATCHQSDDRHFGLFGNDCAQCHATDRWNIPAFRHPPPTSLDCAQCHQAPPSHYMEHFKMISQKVAGQPHAEVNQCYVCHQTTSWPDIKGVGWYKHH